MFQHDFVNQRVDIRDPIGMSKASGFLWNKNMMIHMNCRGYAVAQFMQPEPSKYSHALNMEAKTFMQPEQSYFAHHSGRFFYIKCLDSGELFSIPYEPVRAKLDSFNFSVGKDNLIWRVNHLELEIQLTLSLPKNDVTEMWELSVISHSNKTRNIAIYPYFSVGYMSWMNQSAAFDTNLNGIIASSITPYQKVEDYFKNQHLKDKTFLLSKHQPTSWCANQPTFEGEGGLHNPDALQLKQLPQRDALYQTPVASLQFNHQINCQEQVQHQFLFGPAKDDTEIAQIKEKYFGQQDSFNKAHLDYQNYLAQSHGSIQINSPDKAFNEFINHWLPRQVFYHGDVNRLSTDPQTRNYLQDAMGMAFISPEKTKQALITALSQQTISGAMPDGILLHEQAELKYINLVPHSDHGIWLTLCLNCYLNETNDADILTTVIPFADSAQCLPLIDHINLTLDHLLNARNELGLSYIEQGDWCDPMNMVGYKGKGVSAWLTVATAYSLKVWCDICQHHQINQTKIPEYLAAITKLNTAMNTHFWDGKWYARGINDEGIAFGVSNDEEGKIYLNPQTWAMLSGAADQKQQQAMITAIDDNLATPFGIMMLAPSYTKMNENIGRLTQKFPGVSENGSVYNHAAAFYAYSLYQNNQSDKAFDVLKKMLPSQDDATERQQLPTFVPNYYRGAYYQLPEVAGRSSQLFNTGTVAWYYRCIIEELCGLKGQAGTLIITPKLPAHWATLTVRREYLGATFVVDYTKSDQANSTKIVIDGQPSPSNIVSNIAKGQTYHIKVIIGNSEN
ncbi:GH36-type glycosyl hydrolase domain-containing protein [Thalassotalea castellviae]|uniref:Amylo-alpha-1,6-glucosidase n=1 Tax=Thalassotalea castellviae TaxID=3075612 RepID=A0ABU3A485_9GAMM|nr:amylo-alpha-1,6-glucosidase [Thalassotalea sp. W431]MDT0603928.1 amylo-alpha-1,6-glucosidase [Thalassotalea sp. W431]